MRQMTLQEQAVQCLETKGLEEVQRHASVSTENRHYCHECFCCACVDLLRELEVKRVREALLPEHRSGE